MTSHRSLLANASHELRSPLARMKMAVSMMSDVSAEHAHRLRQEIHKDIRELDELVEEVLLASRLDARPEIERHPVDLLGLLIEEAQRTGAEVQASPEATTLEFQADERLLRRAVRNLLENARRYGHAANESAQVDATLQIEPHHVAFVIEDRGPGVPDDQRERIFEPFYSTQPGAGSGLGLTFCKNVVETVNGQISVAPNRTRAPAS